ncbi:Pr6Pr family membrane protein [Maritimibacter dapengensis]|uniref:Pr6Pr family membrane protein n=1 Tax=Maritimibacter dapengensis TaxID=2836868 RepID=A0ABS6SYV4_9RHOB|nr:Pr6Pr family membrane protein [Maritimibacter dapengensis]MBV7377327.1 Pr6Pr family membrane protein [Maritimibacter dapengensis]
MTGTARLAALIVALLAWAGLIAQFIVSLEINDGRFGLTFWVLARYFTILTNLLVALTFTAIAASGGRAPAGWTAALTLWILIVGVVYHTLLADYSKTGLDFFADHATHTFVPLLTALWWFAFARHVAFPWRLAVIWLIWPLLYVSYALIRGAFDGIYPYFFIDLGVFTPQQVALNSVGLCLAFWLAGLVMIAVARARARV